MDGGAEQHLAELLAALAEPRAHPGAPRSVSVLQTHVSALFFADDVVLKLKKPVDLGFVDQSTLERRHAACLAEVRLNARITPSMYLGVRAVRRRADGSLAVDGAEPGAGDVVDWVVAMKRLPSERMLDALAARDALTEADLALLCHTLAEFHARAAAGPAIARHGAPDHLRAKLLANVDQLVRAALPHRDVLPLRWFETVRSGLARFVDERRDLLASRAAQGRVREGHGDLHAGNVCLVDGAVYVYDCVEFDLDLRADDVACDLAFLVMDLDHRGHHDHAQRVVALYAEAAGDPEVAELIAPFAAHRAAIRAKVQLLSAHDPSIDARARGRALDEARRYTALALGYLVPIGEVVLLGGAGGAELHREVTRCLRRPPRAAANARGLSALDRPVVLAPRGVDPVPGVAAWIAEPERGGALAGLRLIVDAVLDEASA
jgi:aminoglycoside phosphotransferase family enzyme